MMRGKILAAAFLAACFIFPAEASAQTTVVSGTILDPSGIPYAFGTVKAQLSAGPATVTINNQAQCISAGAGSAPCQLPISGTAGPTPLDSTGHFSMTLYSNTSITPASTEWIFTTAISPGMLPPLGTGQQSFQVSITITGTTQDISSTLSAAAPALTVLPIGGEITACFAPGGVGFENGTANKLTCSPNLIYTNPGGSCGLTTVGALVECDGGTGNAYNSSPTMFESLGTVDAGVNNMVWANTHALGNTGTTRKSFLSLSTQGTAFASSIQFEYFVNGVDLGALEFGSGTTAISLGAKGKVTEVGAFGSVDPNAVTETWYQPDGDIRWLTPAGFGGCFQGSTSGQACLAATPTGSTLLLAPRGIPTNPLMDIDNASAQTTGGLLSIRGTGIGNCDGAGSPCLANFVSDGGVQIFIRDSTAAAGDVGYLYQFSGTVTTGGYNATNEVESDYDIDTGIYTLRTGTDVVAETVDASQNVVWTNNNKAKTFQATVQAFTSLATCATGTEGTAAAVNNSTTATWGATITGGGTNHVLAYCDGTSWTVAGK
jgi:hypothetical protein